MRVGLSAAHKSFEAILETGSGLIASFRGRLGPAALTALLIDLFLPVAAHAEGRLADPSAQAAGLQMLVKSGKIAAGRPVSKGRARTPRPMTLCTRVMPGNAAGRSELFRDLPRTDCLLLESFGLTPDGTVQTDDAEEIRTFVDQIDERGDIPQLIPIIDNLGIADADPVAARRILSDASAQDRLAVAIQTLAVKHGFSSVVLELFTLDSASAEMFGAMVDRMAAALRAKSISLGIALPLDAAPALKRAVMGGGGFHPAARLWRTWRRH